MQPLCTHVAVINYFYTFTLGMWVLKLAAKLPAVVACLHCQFEASEGSKHPAAPVLCLIKLGVIGVSPEV